MAKNKKIYGITAMFIFMCVLFLGCSLSAGGVKLANRKEIIKYVNGTVGEAEFIKEVKGENRIDYYFKEPVTGIEFTASTYATPVGLDGSTFFYSESRKNDFYEKYASRVMSEIQPELDEIKSRYKNLVIERNVFYDIGGDSLLKVSFIKYEENFTEEDVIKIGKEIADILDGKEPLNKYDCVDLYDGRGNQLGKYSIAKKEFISKEEIYDENMNEYFEMMIHMRGYAGEKKPKVHSVFLRKEEMRAGDIPGIENVEILQGVMYDDIPDVTMDTLVFVYYYEFDGEEYFLADHIHIESEYDRGKLYIGKVKN